MKRDVLAPFVPPALRGPVAVWPVPQGRKKSSCQPVSLGGEFCRPCGTSSPRLPAHPAMNRWAILFRPAGWPKGYSIENSEEPHISFQTRPPEASDAIPKNQEPPPERSDKAPRNQERPSEASDALPPTGSGLPNIPTPAPGKGRCRRNVPTRGQDRHARRLRGDVLRSNRRLPQGAASKDTRPLWFVLRKNPEARSPFWKMAPLSAMGFFDPAGR